MTTYCRFHSKDTAAPNTDHAPIGVHETSPGPPELAEAFEAVFSYPTSQKQ